MASGAVRRTCGALRAGDVGTDVELYGWVNRRRDHGGLIFVDLRDREGITQVVFDPEHAVFRTAEGLRHEDVLRVRGQARRRPAGTENLKLETGEVEVSAQELEILNRSQVPPFPVNSEDPVEENLRLEYRYLDLRRPRMQRNLAVRHRLIKAMREFFDERGFVEIETPLLIKSTPEGARDFIVPSRMHPGSFYALPQSPQLLKQICMISGIERYMQIARALRDEDLRADRQLEHTQLDVEMSFCTQEEIMEMMESCMRFVWQSVLGIEVPPFPRLTHAQALERYGTDKPDLRFGLELANVSDAFADTEFTVFKTVLQAGGAVIALRYPAGGALSRRDFDGLVELAKTFEAKGLVWIALGADGVKSPAQKYLTEDAIERVRVACSAEAGDALLLFADARDTALAAAGKMRGEVAERCGLRDPKVFTFCWVTDFPYLERDPETGTPIPAHHAFTAPVQGEWDLIETDPFRMRAQHYDIVLNGTELGSGSIRIHKSELQRRILTMLGMSPEQIEDRFGFFLRALDYGAPPHGGMALGVDRIVMLACGEQNIREVIAFPKTQTGRDVMMDAPSPVPAAVLRELHLKSTAPPEKSG